MRSDPFLFIPNIGGHQTVTIGAAAASSVPLSPGIQAFCAYSDVDCHIAVGGNPTASASDFFLPANTLIALRCRSGDMVSVIQSTGPGTLHISEVTH